MGVPERIKKLRKDKKLSQEAFAESLGVKQPNIAQLESGAISLSSDLAQKISNTYNVTVDWLYTGKENENAEDAFHAYQVKTQREKDLENHIEDLRKILGRLETEIDRKEDDKSLYKELLKSAIFSKSQQQEELDIRQFFPTSKEYNRALAYLDAPLDELAICITDRNGKILFVNDNFTSQTGYTLNEMRGKKPGDVLQGDDTEKNTVSKMRYAIRNEKRFEGEVINYSKEGEPITCKLIFEPVFKNDKLDKFISLAVFSKINVLKYN